MKGAFNRQCFPLSVKEAQFYIRGVRARDLNRLRTKLASLCSLMSESLVNTCLTDRHLSMINTMNCLSTVIVL